MQTLDEFLIRLLKDLGYNVFGILFANDIWGSEHNTNMNGWAAALGLRVVSARFSYSGVSTDRLFSSIEDGVRRLHEGRLKVIVAFIQDDSVEMLAKAARKYAMGGSLCCHSQGSLL